MNDNKVPAHVSFIMDGNGRWAKERGKERVFGHFEGVESVRACTQAAVKAGVRYVSFYAFSEENWGRPEAEVSTLMQLMAKSMVGEFKTFMDNGIRFLVRGNLERLSPDLQQAISKMEDATKDNATLTMIIFLSYSGRWDILHAAKELAKRHLDDAAIDSLQIGDLSELMVTSGIPDPDLIVRTSGEQRISNYLLWQCAYSEFYFTPVLWPDFREEEFFKALEDYASRDRRYGKVK